MSQLRNMSSQSTAETRELTKMSKNYRATRNLTITWCASLIGISLIILQDYISTGISDVPIFISLLAFALALPLLTGTIFCAQIELYNVYILKPQKRLHNFSRLTFWLGAPAVFIGIDTAIWHLTWIAGILFLAVSSIVYINFGNNLPKSEELQRAKREEAERKRAIE